MEKLYKSRICVFGIGGGGSYAAEALVRSGVGALDLVDYDKVCVTNLNRQLFATRKTVGEDKTSAAEARLLEINPNVRIIRHNLFFLAETEFDLTPYDFVFDCIDTVSGKVELAVRAKEAGVPIISAMSAGNKTDPTAFRVADLYETAMCPLARVMRYELKRRGVERLRVVYSEEAPKPPAEDEELSCKKNCVCPPGVKRKCADRRSVPASNSFVPPVVGLIMAGEAVKSLASALPAGKSDLSAEPIKQV